MSRAEEIFQLAQESAHAYHIFKLRRAGASAPFVDEFINHLKSRVARDFEGEVVNQSLNGPIGQPVDFWLGDEGTIMEIEFDILSSPPVLEKRIFKALLAKDAGIGVRSLIIIGDPGSVLLARAPIPAQIIDWVKRHHRIGVEIWELKDHDVP